ncbi:MAG: Asp-tRNA(Asn)/Glu-tRNA(Gln) amidotransferase subunit GatA [Chitinophagaceae bacterium]
MRSITSIKDYHIALQNGHTTCVAAVSYFIAAIQEKAHLNAFIEVFEQDALAQAAMLDAHIADGKPLLPLHGVVVGIKDVICYKGHRVTAASNMLKGFESLYSATAVERLIAAGAIIIGRQNCDEFAMGSSNEHSAYGKVLNAADEARVPGGSSGGSAVAVQANLCMISLGSDTGGSVRQPADFCGIVGVKPSYGRVSRYGLIAYASSFDQIGVFAHYINDAALVLATIAGPDGKDSTALQTHLPQGVQHTTPYRPMRLAYFKEALAHEGLDATIKAAFEQLFQQLKAAGHTVTAVDFPLLTQMVPTYYVLTTAEASSNLSRYDGVKFGFAANEVTQLNDLYIQSRTAGFGKEVKRRIMLGNFVLSAGYYDAYFSKAQQVRRLLQQQTRNILASYDAIISPTVPGPAWRFGEKSTNPTAMFLADIFTVHANLVGSPAMSIPAFQYEFGMPFGVQVLSAEGAEATMFEVAHELARLVKPELSIN